MSVPVLLVDDVTDYLPLGGLDPRPHADKLRYPIPPVCVWVPCTELPVTPMCSSRGPRIGADVPLCVLQVDHGGRHVADESWGPNVPTWGEPLACLPGEYKRPVREGDVVHLAQPCPQCGDHQERWGPGPPYTVCAQVGCNDHGAVPMASGIVIEVVWVANDGYDEPEDDAFVMTDGNVALLHQWDQALGRYAPQLLSGDWSEASWGVRVSEVTPL